ncbi:hypothetical protein GQ607_009856 [Colletotrichum asianum]|uniref:Uncharacterized protein n=1 Tax=Colletotrichum asianum TaxID=702518 RepID=A0A8H3ZQV8_9PEZI|nr:hypothetical protein GQ607_009856 [Colletotrichum asianum]
MIRAIAVTARPPLTQSTQSSRPYPRSSNTTAPTPQHRRLKVAPETQTLKFHETTTQTSHPSANDVPLADGDSSGPTMHLNHGTI